MTKGNILAEMTFHMKFTSLKAFIRTDKQDFN